ncbi:MAG: acetyl-CoA carboxylase biotin carboxyl carrier protein [Candidatus Omnitrophica bacterium]|nr:acetyl-CoA carboxylase biotin carboxyl carrier protein [Candidatus Omnitrophota bacterium]MCM8826753.1 acetyl-CoA carboxylase biotin carboxyl carrier protein [Candidatus Omnitrophota bacterium]
MEIKNLKELIEFMNENNLCELEIEEEGKRIKLKKFSQESLPVIKESVVSKPLEKVEKEEKKSEHIEIKSPMVGTFYRAPSPGAKPYVDIGDEVKPGDIVCIIEAMKLMNEIKSEVGGIVAEILVNNAEPVEYGQTLFLIKPL